ncbi:hypothetical protein AGLY_014144 [Aphis glycines]|uniref:Uncharacterized protein n=1 Tax=Aphis glycines TaxID=307491 RepID=A0A6G0T490_APHGL|nr:hypothetical protein AGLY_014144 [Aphis glycines]
MLEYEKYTEELLLLHIVLKVPQCYHMVLQYLPKIHMYLGVLYNRFLKICNMHTFKIINFHTITFSDIFFSFKFELKKIGSTSSSSSEFISINGISSYFSNSFSYCSQTKVFWSSDKNLSSWYLGSRAEAFDIIYSEVCDSGTSNVSKILFLDFQLSKKWHVTPNSITTVRNNRLALATTTEKTRLIFYHKIIHVWKKLKSNILIIYIKLKEENYMFKCIVIKMWLISMVFYNFQLVFQKIILKT